MSNLYVFAQFVLDPGRRTLSQADTPVFLTPKGFDVLSFLVQNPNRLVTKDELLQAVWGDTFVEEGNLKQHISHLRKALGDNSENPSLIVTIARRGYQFIANVSIAEAPIPRTHAPLQVSAVEGFGAHAQPATESPARDAIPRAPSRWRKGALVGASGAVLLVAVGFFSWLHFASITHPTAQKLRLAVLPFENLTGDPAKEYLADGLTEETISELGRLSPDQLGVIARTSVMGYKHKDTRLDQIGRDLSVQYVLENSIRESGDHIRLTSQLILVKDQTHVWSREYDYPVKDILSVEEDMAKSVAREIQIRLTPQRPTEGPRPQSVEPEAFEAYLQAYYFFERNTDKDTEIAARYYERATQLDPSFAPAWAGLSRVRKWQAMTGLVPADQGYQVAREAVQRALALNPNLAEAHIQLGRIQQQVDFDWAGATASFQRAVALEPGNPDALSMAASSAVALGRFNEALKLSRRGVDVDPLNASSWSILAETEYYLGQLREAEAHSKKSIELSPDVFAGPILLSRIYLAQGRPQDALPEIKLVRSAPMRAYLYAIAYSSLDRERESGAALNELMTTYRGANPYQIAQVYAVRNQPDRAFEWLDRAYSQRNSGLIEAKVDPFLKNLHSDPRFAAFLKKLNFPT